MNTFRPGLARFILALMLLTAFGQLAAYAAPSTRTSTYKVSGAQKGDFFASVTYTSEKPLFGIVLKEYPVEKLKSVNSTSNSNLKLQPHFAFSIEIVDGDGKDYDTSFQPPLTIALTYPKGTNFFILDKEKNQAVFMQDLRKNPEALSGSVIKVQTLTDTDVIIQVLKWVPGDPCCGG
jgi:hypothetical protein